MIKKKKNEKRNQTKNKLHFFYYSFFFKQPYNIFFLDSKKERVILVITQAKNAKNRKNKTKTEIKNKKKKKEKKKNDRIEFDYLGRAVSNRLFTGAIPLLFDAGAFACCVSTLGRFAPL